MVSSPGARHCNSTRVSAPRWPAGDRGTLHLPIILQLKCSAQRTTLILTDGRIQQNTEDRRVPLASVFCRR